MGNDAFTRTGVGYFQQINQRLVALERRLPPSYKVLAGRGLRDDGGAGTGLDPKTLMNLSGTTAERDALFGTPATDPDRVALANLRVQWYNIEYGWLEQYYATTGTSGLTVTGLVSGVSHGWYPTGHGPAVFLIPSASISVSTGTRFTNFANPGTGLSYRTGGTAYFTVASGVVTVVKGGRYNARFQISIQNGAGDGAIYLTKNDATSGSGVLSQDSVSLKGSLGSMFRLIADDVILLPDDNLRGYAASIGSATFAPGGTGTDRGSGGFWVEYIGPALVSN